MKIDVYVVCRNEAVIAPFYVDYWKALSDDVDVYVYDQMSDDGTREILSKYNFVHIIDREYEGLDDKSNAMVKNTCWKNSVGKADFVMVSDFDETIFSYDVETLRSELKKMKDEGYSVLWPLSFNIIGDAVPEYEEGRYLHEIIGYGFNEPVHYTKMILFDPNKISNMNFTLGSHVANPVGDVKIYTPDDMFLIHAKYLSLDYYLNRIDGRKLSRWNKNMGYFAEQNHTADRRKKEYYEYYNKRFEWSKIREVFNDYYKVKQDWSVWGGPKR